MHNTINHVIEQSYYLTKDLHMQITGSGGDATAVRITFSKNKWYRFSLTPTTGDGSTDALPLSLFAKFKDAFKDIGGSYVDYTPSLTSDGHVTLIFTGTPPESGQAQVLFEETELQYLLGITNAGSPSAWVFADTNVRNTGVYVPTHVLYWCVANNDTGFTRMPKQVAAAQQPNGVVYGWPNSCESMERTFDVAYLPTFDDASIIDIATITPMHKSYAEMVNPSGYVSTLATQNSIPPWSFDQFMRTACGNRIGYCIGSAQQHFVTSMVDWFDGYVSADSLKQQNIEPSIKGFKGYRTWKGLKLTLTNAYDYRADTYMI